MHVMDVTVNFCAAFRLFVCEHFGLKALSGEDRREERRRERLLRRGGGCLSYSQHESCRKSLPTTIEFLLYLPGFFFHLASIVCRPQSRV